jgi:hypothetical protein
MSKLCVAVDPGLRYYLCVQNAITKLELSFVLAKVKSKFGVPIWEIKEHFLVGD